MSSFLPSAKYLLRRAEVSLRSFAMRPRYDLSGRSASDRGLYPDLALRAAIDPRLFSVFRRHPDYTPILEHVDPRLGALYLSIIRDHYGLSSSDVLSIVEPLSLIGSPRLYSLPGLSRPVSTTALRYLKVALDITCSVGVDLGDVVEIGCGYGGQSIILSRVANLRSYTFIDIWQVNLLLRAFVESVGVDFEYTVSTLSESFLRRSSWDFAISNYAFSELPLRLQRRYIDSVLAHASSGYMTMNSGSLGSFGSILNLSRADLLDIFPSSDWRPEFPLTMPDNYILGWGSCGLDGLFSG